ncbi:hypothetical protein BFG04_08305 [Campylobacter pinnipediorum subsp. pinnipediorum]|uniref:Methyltransferase domain-containing protein n=1 Tax=Campylobacter pinnipediorum subsp. pinnipediorum TaxID=1660067 RepID=A0AAX0LBX1_9BACT|nr:class I SAM-dependent methyltransferase [Campylobacter pinnipediorum]OPA81956.1 hypothetical protein BFG04_08305 [Campylobacter pinnipediorum subsp. pinnipediorum]
MKDKLWDKKSSKYPRFKPELEIFNEAIFLNLQDFGIDFKDKDVLDIGCGTGIWTLYLAKICNHIIGIDSSLNMLEILKEDANTHNIKNIDTLCSSWVDFKPNKHYDIAISTMSPAIRENDDFQKFSDIADTKIYLNFSRPRKSTLLEPFFERFGVKPFAFNSSSRLEKWLIEHNIKFKKIIFGESRNVMRSKDEAFENICWHLDINNANYNRNLVLDILNDSKNDKFSEKIESLITLFVF